MASIQFEKVEQAVGILRELDIDCWLTFVRETTESGDPVLPLLCRHALTWQSALVIAASGERIAIVGKYDDEALRRSGVWPEVLSYVEGIRDPLLAVLADLAPRSIALNYSPDDVKADGLSHGMFELLRRYLAGTPYEDRLCSAEAVVAALRGRKTSGEIERIRRAVGSTEEIFEEIAAFAESGRGEGQIARFARERVAERGLSPAWEDEVCPIVTTGPDSMLGHGLPSDELVLEPGRILHLDFGVRRDDYCSDLQRCWYLPESGETEVPSAVRRGFEAVRGAIGAAAAALAPGVEGWTVDEAARGALVDAGFPEYQHATGHQVGRSAHDGGAILGPRWERYGRTPFYRVEAGNVFTLELGIDNLDGRGYLGLEEMVLVTDEGVRWLSRPQTELPLL